MAINLVAINRIEGFYGWIHRAHTLAALDVTSSSQLSNISCSMTLLWGLYKVSPLLSLY